MFPSKTVISVFKVVEFKVNIWLHWLFSWFWSSQNNMIQLKELQTSNRGTPGRKHDANTAFMFVWCSDLKTSPHRSTHRCFHLFSGALASHHTAHASYTVWLDFFTKSVSITLSHQLFQLSQEVHIFGDILTFYFVCFCFLAIFHAQIENAHNNRMEMHFM